MINNHDRVEELVMKELLSLYRDRLTDLTANNKSLKLMRLTNKNHFDIHTLSNIQNGLHTKILEEVCALNDQIPLFAQNSLEEEAMLANHKLQQLKREVDLIEQETGNNPFYVAYGFLEGFLVPEFYIRCPILFYPSRLSKSNVSNKPYWVLEVGDENAPFINKTFIMAIQKYIGGDISNSISEELEKLPKALAEIIPFLYELLKRHDISLTVETSQSITAFKNMNKENIPDGKNAFTLVPYAIMGKFQQSTSTLLNDYNHLIENPPIEGYLHDLIEGSEGEDSDFEEIDNEMLNNVHPSENFFVLETDASQEAAVVAARSKKGLIVHGPPGTGKSQVIVNLIVDRMARGQRVLLVCQKPTALDVVYNRLGKINLQNHVALVHDFNKNKMNVYGKIASVIEKGLPRSSQDYDRISTEKYVLSEKLNQIATSLHKERPFGKSLYYLYSKTKWNQDQIIEVSDLLDDITYDDLRTQLIDLHTIIELMQKYDHPNYAWHKRKSFASFSAKHHLELKNVMQSFVDQARKASGKCAVMELLFKPVYFMENHQTLLGLEQALEFLKNRNLHRHILKFFVDNDREFENEDHLVNVKQKYASLRKQIEILKNRTEVVEGLSLDEAKVWNENIKQFDKMNKKITRFLNANWYSRKKELQVHCREKNISFDGNSVHAYRERIESLLLFERLRGEAGGLHFFKDAPSENRVSQWENWILLKDQSIQFLEEFVQAQVAFPNWIKNPDSIKVLEEFYSEAFADEVRGYIELSDFTTELHSLIRKTSSFISNDESLKLKEQINKGEYDLPTLEGLQQSVDDFNSLSRLDQMKEEMGNFKKSLIARCAKKAPFEMTPNAAANWLQLIENSFMHEWILQVEEEEPHVKDVSTEMYQRNLERFAAILKEKRKAVPLLVDSRLGHQALEVVGTARQKLKHESNKKRKLLPLRQVVGHFYDDLLKLVPCWLCTPEAVSAIFPMEQNMFDLVIFDEASQCPVENAVPSIYRAKQLVIAGDEKQLPPSSFFQASADDEESDEEDNNAYVDRTDKQAKSLLEWSKSKFPDQWLTWHYRSNYDDLINFSNYAFYDKRVQIAPSVSNANHTRPIEFISVEGLWENRSNRVEAEKIVDTVLDILQNDDKKPTLGVITFNKQQADLINDVLEQRLAKNPEYHMLIEEARNRKNGDEHVGLFVKNIENVQGDERDVILFSVGYAKDTVGKMVSNFGPLSRDGGENRLNVAISRAKNKIYIVCSFEPREWTRVETYARGVRLFKRYLEYGKAISDANHELAQSILNGLVDATNVLDTKNHLVFDSGFEEEVCKALRDKGYEIHTQVGFSGYRIDLAIVDPVSKERYILGVECDGAAYHSSKVARERDLYRQRFLESKGWKIHRIWSRNWWLGKNKEIEKITEKIKPVVNV